MPLIAEKSFSYALTAGEEPQIVLSPQLFSYAPVAGGAAEGCAYVVLGGKVIGEVTLVWGTSLEETTEKEKSFLDRLFGGI